ncbi:hypothetical protein FVE85_7584 [Porphyridium purpureum]|uniref:Methyltransferase type 11 domain-containing protein n=1 Tax=Porphyridium purpureum TaxID=35688 RepID=A0A5J4Z7I4_PORPP|nr:hypothetical protein FVE85_7584 [Porphyridium purpureum]|eukprot:POR9438..scf295_1
MGGDGLVKRVLAGGRTGEAGGGVLLGISAMNTNQRPSGRIGTLTTVLVTSVVSVVLCVLALLLSGHLRAEPAAAGLQRAEPLLEHGFTGQSDRSAASSEVCSGKHEHDVPGNVRRNPFQEAMKGWAAQDPVPKRVCPCCGWSGDVFAHLKIMWSQWGDRPDKQCPRCKSLERHRSACSLFGAGKHPFLAQEGAEFLQPPQGFGSVPFRLAHFGPEKTMDSMLNQVSDMDQIGMDFMPWLYGPSTFFADITSIPLPTNFSDGVVVLHVMEHIPALEKATQELVRILRPKTGWALAEVPCYFEQTRDCRDKDYNGRKECAGQPDHVWGFNCDDFVSRMRQEGLHCRRVNLEEDLQPWATKLIPSMRVELLPSYICSTG